MFSDSDDDDVVPLSQRIAAVAANVPNGETKPTSVPQVVDVVESSSSPIPVSSSPEVVDTIPDAIHTLSSQLSALPEEGPYTIEDSSSPLPPLPDDDFGPSPAVTPRVTKKKKPNTPKVAPLTASGKKKKSRNKESNGEQKLKPDPKPKVKKDNKQSSQSSQDSGKRPAAKISCRDCEARIDHSLIESHFTDEQLRKAFCEFDVRFKYNTECLRPKTITWIREVKVPNEDPDGDDSASERIVLKEENQVMVLLDATDFAQMVHMYKLSNSLEEDIEVLSLEESGSSGQSVDSSGDDGNESPLQRSSCPSFNSFCRKVCVTYPGKNVTVLIVGLTQYYQKLKSKENKKYRDIIHGKDPSRRKSSNRYPRITRDDVTEVLINLDLNSKDVSKDQSVRVLFADRSEDVVTQIASFTKSIAEAPFKRNDSRSMAWFADGDKTVSTDVKSKEDLPKLWRKQLEQFPKVSQLVAQSIANVYPTPLDLLDTYNNIYDRHESEGLLRDISIGTTGNRRVGPELSRKICTFMTAVDGNLFLNNN